ncbi:MAG: DUF6259 domain-containing protein, partial [Kiritimatiellae bacterium]|nr:DUF6259 domain-containing protein [Kiritimatiellia bacterium]
MFLAPMHAFAMLACAAFLSQEVPVLAQSQPQGCLFRYVFDRAVAQVDDRIGSLPQAQLLDGATISDSGQGNVLRLDGRKAHVALPGSEGLHAGKRGVSFCAVVRFADGGATSAEADAHDTVLFKPDEFLLGRQQGQLYLNFHDHAGWNAPVVGGKVDAHVWLHLAAVLERVDDPAQGKTGYRPRLYVNGELVAMQEYLGSDPQSSGTPMDIGKGWGGPWFFHGDVAEVSMFDRALTEGEVEALADASSLVQAARKGVHRLAPGLVREIEALRRSASTEAGQWATVCLRRAGELGLATQVVATTCAEVRALVADTKDEADFVERWNRRATSFRIVETAMLRVMLVQDRHLPCPLIGAQNRATGLEIFSGTPMQWAIEYLPVSGVISRVESGDADVTGKLVRLSMLKSGTVADIEWTHPAGAQPIAFTARSRLGIAGRRLEMDFRVESLSSNMVIRDVIFPVFGFAKMTQGTDTLVYPRFSGLLVNHPAGTRSPVSQEGVYPSGAATLPFGAYYDERAGVYFGFEDPLARTKSFTVTGKRESLQAAWRSLAGLPLGRQGGNGFECAGRAVVEVFAGDWFDAGQIYKRWLAREAHWWPPHVPRLDTPAWFRENCLWLNCLTGGPQPQGDEQMVAELKAIRDYLGLPYGIHWSCWNDAAEAWPNFHARPGVEDSIKQLQAQGIFVKAYIDSRLWGIVEPSFPTVGRACAVKSPDGALSYESYGPTDAAKYAVMCPAAAAWRQRMVAMAQSVAGHGFDALYHDQVATAAPLPCYDPAHGHALGGG